MEKEQQNSQKLDMAAEFNNINNWAFIETVINSPRDAHPAVCIKEGDPEKGGWSARKYIRELVRITPDKNCYINCSSFYIGRNGTYNVQKENFAAYHFIVLDDVGTKIPWSRLKSIKPTWVLETSAGNFQVGFVLTKPILDLPEAEALIKAVINAGLSDKGMTGVSRWVRLPQAINGKEKYKKGGKPFQCRLIQWNPVTRYTVTEIVEILSLKLEEEHDAKVETTEHFSISNSAVSQLKQCGTTIERTTIEPNSKNLADLIKLLQALSPDIGYTEWTKVGMAIFFTTGGSDDGLDLYNAWSSAGRKYRGRREIESKWRSFRLDVPNPVTIGTLIHIAKSEGVDTLDLLQEKFETCETVVIKRGE